MEVVATLTKNECPTCGHEFAPNGLPNHVKRCGRICAVDGCATPTKTAGYCSKHYQRKRKYGDPTIVHRYRDDSERPECEVPGCSEGVRSKGMCRPHYINFWRETTDWTPPACEVDECDRPQHGRGWCHLHHERWLRRGSTDDPDFVNYGPVCSNSSCCRESYAKGLCFKHYMRVWRANNADKVRATHRRRLDRETQLLVEPFTDEQLEGRMSMFSGCWMCGGEADAIDHVKPLAAGGLNCLSNMRPACTPCNSRKQAKWPFDLAGVA